MGLALWRGGKTSTGHDDMQVYYIQWYKHGISRYHVAISSGPLVPLGPLGPLCAAGRSGRSDHFGQYDIDIVAYKAHGPLRDRYREYCMDWNGILYNIPTANCCG